MEKCSNIFINTIFGLMFSCFVFCIEEALLTFLVLMMDFIMKEFHECYVFSIFNVLCDNLSFLSILSICIEFWITKLAFYIIFFKSLLDPADVNFFTLSILEILFVSSFFWCSWIVIENTVVSVTAFKNVSKIISFHFAELSFKNILG